MTSRWLNLFFTLLLTLFHVRALASGHAEHKNSLKFATKSNAATTDNVLTLRRRTAATDAISQTVAVNTIVDEGDNIVTSSKNNQHPSTERRTKDVEDILNGMAHKDPSQWEATEWIVFLLFISFFGWIACCLCSMCCCGRGGGSNLLGWLLCWEVCCRDGRDLDACCDNYICT
jgi:hypothetical protein